jgi:hypothetical protein
MAAYVRVSDNHLQYSGEFVDLLVGNSVYVCWLGDESTHASAAAIRTVAAFAGTDRHLNRVQHAAYSRVAIGDRFVLHRAGSRDIYVGVVQGAATETVVADGYDRTGYAETVVADGYDRTGYAETVVADHSWRARVRPYCTRAHLRHIASRAALRPDHPLWIAEAVFPVTWTKLPAVTDEQIAWCSSVRGTFVHRKTLFPVA